MTTTGSQARYSLSELAALAGVTPRTVRYYIAQGLLPAAAASGPGAKYGDAHLGRLRLIRRLQQNHQPLATIRQQLERLGDDRIAELERSPAPLSAPADSALDYIRRLLAPPEAAPSPAEPQPLLRRMHPPDADSAPAPAPETTTPTTEPAPPPLPAEPARSQWERIVLAPDVELHVRRPLTRTLTRRVDRLVTIGRELLEEDPT